MKRLAVFISGSGTNMQSVIDASYAGRINAGVALVISSNYEAKGLDRAKKHGIDSYVCALKDFESNEMRDRRIMELLELYKIDLVVLAGYLGILTGELIDKYSNRIINVHPSLLPKYGGKNFYGLNVHNAVIEAVMKAGEKESGVTVHYADKGIDTGPIIAQRRVPVLANDTADDLQKRVLEHEHELLVEVLADLCK
ncbi:phosphoribosylglycinamide formyltransferase [Holotrichia oblita]|nr:phosphoribosylglycinamide formyltransferase [Holotrichia oblita]